MGNARMHFACAGGATTYQVSACTAHSVFGALTPNFCLESGSSASPPWAR